MAEGIDRMVTGIESPVTSERGLSARLRYLTASDAGYRSHGPRRHPRPPPHPNVRGLIWDRAVDAWIAHDARELEAIWDETIQGGLGTDWDAYTYVSSVG